MMTTSLSECVTRATNILCHADYLVTDDLVASETSAAAFVEWMDQFSVSRTAFEAAVEEHDIYTLPSHEDGWLTDFMYGDDVTYIRDNGGNCYIIPADAERTMPDVYAGEIDESEDDDED